MHKKIVIKSIGIYHPKKIVNNEFFIDHYSKVDETLGTKVSHLLKHLGRENRYIADFPKENTLTMAIEASREAVKKSGIHFDDLDGIIFSTDTPEYTSPSNALLLRDALNANNAHTVYDLNANCVGMVVALDQAQSLMRVNKRINKLLVVGSTMIHHYGSSSDPITYACLGDAAAAVVLESVESNECIGFRDSIYATRTDLHNHVRMPECGLSNVYDTTISEDKKRWKWEPFDTEEAESRCAAIMKQVTEENSYSLDQIKMIFMTQFSEDAIRNVSNILNYPREQLKYVGDQYGYTGTSSPLLALYHAIEDKELLPGDVCVLCSVGSGLTATALLYTVA